MFYSKMHNLHFLCSTLLSEQGSRDNMSVVLVCFPGAPKISQEAVKRQAELDKYLQSRVEGGASKKK